MSKHLGDESGYSLVEVLVSIMILTMAIVPMVAMFDVGLESATLGGNYDRARSLAKKQLEIVQSQTYNRVRANFPQGCPSGPGTFDAGGRSVSTDCTDPDFPGFVFDVEKQYMRLDEGSGTLAETAENRGLMRVRITVSWESRSKQYTATALKAR